MAKTKAAAIEWPADSVERRKVADLVPYARNSRTHSAEQIDQLVESITEWGWTIPVLVDESGGIIAGHGRIMAAQKLKIKDVPCMVARGWSEAQKRAYVIADNKLAENADWDSDLLRDEMAALKALDFNLDAVGFDAAEMAGLFADHHGAPGGMENAPYTRKIEAPVYEITGARPNLDELTDRSKTDELMARIEAAKLPDDLRAFLESAAQRHTRFYFDRIAEFYAHAEPEVQELMEDSALVIIDFDKAIEAGFVKLTKNLMEQFEGEYPDHAPE